MRAYLPFLTSEALCKPPTRMSFQPSVPMNSVDPHADFVILFPLNSFLYNTVHNVGIKDTNTVCCFQACISHVHTLKHAYVHT